MKWFQLYSFVQPAKRRFLLILYFGTVLREYNYRAPKHILVFKWNYIFFFLLKSCLLLDSHVQGHYKKNMKKVAKFDFHF